MTEVVMHQHHHQHHQHSPTDVMAALRDSTTRKGKKDYDGIDISTKSSLAASLASSISLFDPLDDDDSSTASFSDEEDSFCFDHDEQENLEESSVLISDAEEEEDDDDVLQHEVIQVVVEGSLLEDIGAAESSSPVPRSSSSSNNEPSHRSLRRGLSASKSALLAQAVEVNDSLSRENSKLNSLSNNSASNLSSSTRSRGSGSGSGNGSLSGRRRAMKKQQYGQEESLLDGSMSFSQLQVGDMVLLGNKELDTSQHLKRRMPTSSRSRPTSTSMPQKSISEPSRGDAAPMTPSRRSCPKRGLSASISNLSGGRPVLSRENSKLNMLSTSNHGPPLTPRRSTLQRTGSFGGGRRAMKKSDIVTAAAVASTTTLASPENASGPGGRPVLDRENSKLNQLSLASPVGSKGGRRRPPPRTSSSGAGNRRRGGHRQHHRDMNESQSDHMDDSSNKSFSSSVGSDLSLLASKELDTSTHLKRCNPNNSNNTKRWST